MPFGPAWREKYRPTACGHMIGPNLIGIYVRGKMMGKEKQALVFGATGHVGGAAARELLRRGWQVYAVSRTPTSKKAQALAALGAEVKQADMEDRASLKAVLEGQNRVLSVQNWTTSGVEGEIRQGKLVADVAAEAGVEHLVYLSAGIGEPGTGVPHFESKIEVENHMRQLRLPFTILRPGPFMELLTAKEFYPALTAWGVMPKVTGWDTPLPWAAVPDIGTAVANMFEDPETWIGRDLKTLISDIKSLRECQAVFVEMTGKKPLRLPLPNSLFKRLAGAEFITMWQWLVDWVDTEQLQSYVPDSREACPQPLDVASWLRFSHNGQYGRG